MKHYYLTRSTIKMDPEHRLSLSDASGCGVIVFAVSLGVYLATMHPSVAGGDAGELAVVAHTLGVIHPPGYPTLAFTTYAVEKIMNVIAPNMSSGVVQNSFNVVICSAANTVLYLATARLTGSKPAGVTSSSIFAFAPIVWTYATHIEVFGLNNLFLAMIILLGVEYEFHKKSKSTETTIYLVGSFCCGISLTNQHTSVLYVVPLVFWIIIRDYRIFFIEKKILLLKVAVLFLMGLSPYLYLPISAIFTVNPNSWGDCGTVSGFITHFFRKEYGTFSLASQEARYITTSFKRAWEYYCVDVVAQSLQIFWVFGIIGMVVSLYSSMVKRSFDIASAFVLMLVLYLNFFHYLCNLPIDQPLFLGVQQRFWIQPLLLLSLFIGVGLNSILSFFPSKKTVLMWTIAIVTTYLQVSLHFDILDQSNNFIIRDFGRAILRPLPRNAIVLTKGDIMINSARYVQTLENFRPDVAIIDQEMLTYYWYTDVQKKHYNSTIKFPGKFYHPHQRNGFNIAQFFAANRKKRFFLAHGFKDGDHSWEGKYHTMPFGVIHEAVTVNRKQNKSLKGLKKYLSEVERSVPDPKDISLPVLGKYPDWTWEHVVKSDYWMAHHNIGYALLDWHSTEVKRNPSHSTESADYLAAVKSREIFELLVSHNEPPNGIAARNLGVTIQGLMEYTPGDISLLRDMNNAFKKYIEIVETSIDSSSAGSKQQKALIQIKEAVKHYDKILHDGP